MQQLFYYNMLLQYITKCISAHYKMPIVSTQVFSTVTMPKVTIIFFELRVVKNFPEKF